MDTPMVWWVFTDYEPDDFMALMVLRAKYPHVHIHAIITENPADVLQAKYEDAKHFFGEHFTIWIGAPSNKKYAFAKDAAAPDLPPGPVFTAEGIDAPDVLISLAPPRDVIRIATEKPGFFKNTVHHAYGSFNWSCVLDFESNPPTGIMAPRWFQDTFKITYVTETLNVFEQSHKTFNAHTSPEFIEYVKHRAETSSYFRRFVDLSTAWDAHARALNIAEIIKARHLFDGLPADVFDDVNRDATPLIEHAVEYLKGEHDAKDVETMDDILRRLRIVKSMQAGLQFVAADPVVVLMLHDSHLEFAQHVDFVFEGKRFKYVPDETSTLVYVCTPDKALFFRYIARAMVDALRMLV